MYLKLDLKGSLKYLKDHCWWTLLSKNKYGGINYVRIIIDYPLKIWSLPTSWPVYNIDINSTITTFKMVSYSKT